MGLHVNLRESKNIYLAKVTVNANVSDSDIISSKRNYQSVNYKYEKYKYNKL